MSTPFDLSRTDKPASQAPAGGNYQRWRWVGFRPGARRPAEEVTDWNGWKAVAQ